MSKQCLNAFLVLALFYLGHASSTMGLAPQVFHGEIGAGDIEDEIHRHRH